MSTGWKASWSRSRRPIRPSAPTSAICPRSSICRASHQRKWLYYKLFPNVAFDIYPDQVDFMQFLPCRATETVIREISYALPDDRREMKAARYLNWRINRRVNAEDTELITRVQLGMQSPSYVAGPLGTSEVCLRSFAQKLRRMIPEAAAGARRRRPAGAASRAHDHDRPGRRSPAAPAPQRSPRGRRRRVPQTDEQRRHATGHDAAPERAELGELQRGSGRGEIEDERRDRRQQDDEGEQARSVPRLQLASDAG